MRVGSKRGEDAYGSSHTILRPFDDGSTTLHREQKSYGMRIWGGGGGGGDDPVLSVEAREKQGVPGYERTCTLAKHSRRSGSW